jgi:beta-galactosidase
MKRVLIFLMALVAGSAAGGDIYSLNAGWLFFDGVATSSDGALAVVLPHRCYGEGNYVKELDVPEEWADKRVFIKGYGGGPVATVFVNGRLAGEHRGGYTAWRMEVTRLLNQGKNYIHIVCAPAGRFDVLPTAGDMEITGGLFRDMELEVAGREAIGDVWVVPSSVSAERAEGVVRVATDGAVRVEIADSDGYVVARVEGHGEVPFAIDNPRLWHGRRAPHIYTVTIATADDSVAVVTGFRSVEADPARGFLLNGESYPLRGVVVHQDRPLAGAAITRAEVEEDIELIKDMGANAVRVEGVAHHPAFYELCDREGIVVWSDFPLQGEVFLTDRAYVPTPEFRANGLAQAGDIVRQQRNHPSVAIWGVFSNLQARDDNPLEYIRSLNDMACAEGPAQLTAASSNADGELNFVTGLVCWSHHFGWTEGLPEEINTWKRHFAREWGNLCSAVSYGAGASVAHQEPAPSRPDHLGPRHPERWQTHIHEVYYGALSGEAMFWGLWVRNMFDYAAPRRQWGERGVNDLGLVTHDRRVRKDAYYFYKANWNTDEPMTYIAERRWNVRPERRQTIKAYSNQPEAELFINGVSAGVRTGSSATFVWENVELRQGVNTVEVRAGEVKDAVRIEINPAARQRL